jgi:hypothetical protein
MPPAQPQGLQEIKLFASFDFDIQLQRNIAQSYAKRNDLQNKFSIPRVDDFSVGIKSWCEGCDSYGI